MIKFVRIKAEEIHDSIFFGFDRTQIVKRIKYLDNYEIKEKDSYFIEQWSNNELIELARNIKEKVKKGAVLIAAYDNENIAGFACLENTLFDGYLNLDIIQVSNQYRNLGIGKNLFNLILKEAKLLGANKLYISAHSSVETQAFYKSLGCVLAKIVNVELAKREPFDIQLEKTID